MPSSTWKSVVLRQGAVSEVAECGPLTFFALAILQQGENHTGRQYLMKGSEAVVWATTPFGASEGDADTYETGTNNICCASRAMADAGCSLLGFVGGEKAHEKERGGEEENE